MEDYYNINSTEVDTFFKPGDIIVVNRGNYWDFGIWVNFNSEEKIFHVTGNGNSLNYFSGSNPGNSTSEGIARTKTTFTNFVNGDNLIKRVRYIFRKKSKEELD